MTPDPDSAPDRPESDSVPKPQPHGKQRTQDTALKGTAKPGTGWNGSGNGGETALEPPDSSAMPEAAGELTTTADDELEPGPREEFLIIPDDINDFPSLLRRATGRTEGANWPPLFPASSREGLAPESWAERPLPPEPASASCFEDSLSALNASSGLNPAGGFLPIGDTEPVPVSLESAGDQPPPEAEQEIDPEEIWRRAAEEFREAEEKAALLAPVEETPGDAPATAPVEETLENFTTQSPALEEEPFAPVPETPALEAVPAIDSNPTKEPPDHRIPLPDLSRESFPEVVEEEAVDAPVTVGATDSGTGLSLPMAADGEEKPAGVLVPPVSLSQETGKKPPSLRRVLLLLLLVGVVALVVVLWLQSRHPLVVEPPPLPSEKPLPATAPSLPEAPPSPSAPEPVNMEKASPPVPSPAPPPGPEPVVPPVAPDPSAPPPVSEAGARALIDRLLTATSAETVTPLILDATRLKPGVENYFTAGKFTAGPAQGMELVDTEQPGPEGKKAWNFKVTTAAVPGGFPVTVEETPEGLKTNWDFLIQCRDQRLAAFLANPAAVPAVFYVTLTRVPSPAATGTEAGEPGFLAFDLFSPGSSDAPTRVLMPTKTPRATQAEALFPLGQSKPPQVALSHREGRVEITGIVRENWHSAPLGKAEGGR